MKPSVADDEYETPKWVVSLAEVTYNLKFEIDAFSTDKNAVCKKHFTKEDNALEMDWVDYGENQVVRIVPIFVNHPHTLHKESLEKCEQQWQKFGMPITMIIPANTQRTTYWHRIVEKNRFKKENTGGHIHVDPIEGSIVFLKDGKPVKDKKGKIQQARNAYLFVYWEPRSGSQKQ